VDEEAVWRVEFLAARDVAGELPREDLDEALDEALTGAGKEG